MTRQYGHGSLHQRTDGRWVGRLPDGRGGYRYVNRATQDEAERALDSLRRERDRTTSRSPRGGERLRDLADRYLSAVAPLRNRPRTLEDHRQVNRDHIEPVLGHLYVTQVRPADVQRMVTRMLDAGLSPKTVQNAVGVLSAILRHAMREGTVTVNVAGLAVVPPVVRPRLPSLTTDQAGAFIEATRGEPFWPVWTLAATTGMRVSEVLGLLWRDVTPTTIAVTGQYRRVVRPDGGLDFKRVEPKTAQSVRLLHLPELAQEALRVAKANANSPKLVFANRRGQPWERSYVTERFRKALTAHGFPAVRFHSLRHSAAVAMLDATFGDVRAVSAVLGHANLATTADTYGAEADAARKRAAEAMDRAMQRRVK